MEIVKSPVFETLKRPCIKFSSWSKPEKGNYPEHKHLGKWELVYTRKGLLIHCINGVRREHLRGDFALIREIDRHSTENIDGESINISISPEYYPFLTGPEKQPGNFLFKLLTNPDTITGHVPEGDVELFERRLENLMFQQGTEYEAVFFCAFFFETISRYVALPPLMEAAKPEMPEWLARCLSHFERNANELLSVKALVSFCGRSQEHVTRCFRKHLSTTPSEFVNARRMEQVGKLLANTDKPVKEIALECGYSNASYFFRVFKAAYETSPNEYRKRNFKAFR